LLLAMLLVLIPASGLLTIEIFHCFTTTNFETVDELFFIRQLSYGIQNKLIENATVSQYSDFKRTGGRSQPARSQ
jgi:hypothetical protein